MWSFNFHIYVDSFWINFYIWYEAGQFFLFSYFFLGQLFLNLRMDFHLFSTICCEATFFSNELSTYPYWNSNDYNQKGLFLNYRLYSIDLYVWSFISNILFLLFPRLVVSFDTRSVTLSIYASYLRLFWWC